jgi:hypothetical protein
LYSGAASSVSVIDATGVSSVDHFIDRFVCVTRATTDTSGDVEAVGSRRFTCTMSPVLAFRNSGHASG